MKTKLKVFLKNVNCQIIEDTVKLKLEEIDSFLIKHSASRNADAIKMHFSEMETMDGKFLSVKSMEIQKQSLSQKL